MWLLGYPHQAVEHAQRMMTMAQDIVHPHSLTRAFGLMAMCSQVLREGQLVYAQGEQAMTSAAAYGFALWTAIGMILRGWAMSEQGHREEGILQIRHGLEAYQQAGSEMLQPYFLALLADALRMHGETDEGLRAIVEALKKVEIHNERCWEAEIHRLKGELLLQLSSDNQSEAETCFHQALDVARSQQAKSWELRAATSLARLWQSQGKRDEARQLLGDVYGWFTEGFDTADLIDAKALLDALQE